MNPKFCKYKVGDEVIWIIPSSSLLRLKNVPGKIWHIDPEYGYEIMFPDNDHRAHFTDEEVRPLTKLERALK